MRDLMALLEGALDPLAALYHHNGWDEQLHQRNPAWLKQFYEWVATKADPKAASRFAYWQGLDEPFNFWHLTPNEKLRAAQQVKSVQDIPASLWVEFIDDTHLIPRKRPHEDGHNWGLNPLSPEPLPADTWLIHFTHDPLEVFYHGFQRGTPSAEPSELYATFGEGDHKDRPGYNFAFLAKSFEQLSYRDDDFYGESVIMFQARGVHTYHSGDSDEEVIFYGPEVDISRAFLLLRTEHGFSIQSRRSPQPHAIVETLDEAVEWVMANA